MADLQDARSLLEAFRSLPAALPLTTAGLEGLAGVHLVGGAVRDLLLGQAPADLDFVVEGDVDDAVSRLGGLVRTHDRFGTRTVELDGRTYDFARARREAYAAPGALPEVAPAGLQEDLRRRDFSVNALALAVGGDRAGALTGVKHALEDLRDGRLRVLHDASFRDDPTRMLRLARYRARLGFDVDPATRELLDRALAGGALDTVTGTRLGNELRLLAAEADPVAALAAAHELGLDSAIAPGFGLAGPDPTRTALDLLPADGDRVALVLAACGLEMDGGALAGLLDRLAFAARRREAILSAAGGAPALARALSRARLPSEIDAAVGERAGVELVALAGAMGAEEQARTWLERLRRIGLEIDGDDLVAAGVGPGPALGAALRAARAARLDGRARSREEELAAALASLRVPERGQ